MAQLLDDKHDRPNGRSKGGREARHRERSRPRRDRDDSKSARFRDDRAKPHRHREDARCDRHERLWIHRSRAVA
jgi:hypothetical protein